MGVPDGTLVRERDLSRCFLFLPSSLPPKQPVIFDGIVQAIRTLLGI
jgi:hypothetical protein